MPQPSPEAVQVRAFLNTWRVPHDTGVPVCDLADLAPDESTWKARWPGVLAPQSEDELVALREIRSLLREALGRPLWEGVGPLLEAHRVRVKVAEGDSVGFRSEREGCVGDVAALTAAVVISGEWLRLKACPACHHVFFDHSRNRSRVWCGMAAGTPDGRACGNIAKARAYRARRAASPRDAQEGT